MKIIFTLAIFVYSLTLQAQTDPKSVVTSLGATLVTALNEQTTATDVGVQVIFNISGVEYANTVSIGIGNTSLTADGISFIYDVVKDNPHSSYYLVQQNQRSKFVGSTVSVIIPVLNGKLEEYRGKYVIVTVTDKEGRAAPNQFIEIH